MLLQEMHPLDGDFVQTPRGRETWWPSSQQQGPSTTYEASIRTTKDAAESKRKRPIKARRVPRFLIPRMRLP